MAIPVDLRTHIANKVRMWTSHHRYSMQAEISLRVVEARLPQDAPYAEATTPRPTRKQWTSKETAWGYILCMYVNIGGNATEQATGCFVCQWRREMMKWWGQENTFVKSTGAFGAGTSRTTGSRLWRTEMGLKHNCAGHVIMMLYSIARGHIYHL
jgi:hypothetical protein